MPWTTGGSVLVDSSALYALLDADDAFHEPARKAWSALLPAKDVQLEDHAGAVQALLAIDRRGLSLVHLGSFHLMRKLGLRSAFTFDEDFREKGFDAVPG